MKKIFRGRGILFIKLVVGKEVIRMIQKNAVLTFGIIAVLVGCVEKFSNSNAQINQSSAMKILGSHTSVG